MINLNELIHDADFNTTFTIRRQAQGTFVKGRYQTTTEDITVTGIVAPASGKDLELLPEGDRESGMKTFYTEVPMYVTGKGSVSDVCIFRGQTYKLTSVNDYSSNGYWKALGTLRGDTDDV